MYTAVSNFFLFHLFVAPLACSTETDVTKQEIQHTQTTVTKQTPQAFSLHLLIRNLNFSLNQNKHVTFFPVYIERRTE